MKKFVVLIILGLMLALIAFGLVPTVPLTTIRAAPNVHELTAADVETFLDGIVPLQLDREDVAGAIVAVVKDGKQLFTKGYGYADVKHKKPVVAAETLFRPGSVSKLFTWTAVMQLVEQGKLDLDRDVNGYLDLKIPEAFGQPISLKNILTHTAGFEEQLKDLFTADKRSPNLGNHLKTHIPKRIFAPGTLWAALKINNLGKATALGSANCLCAESVFCCDSIQFSAFCAKASGIIQRQRKYLDLAGSVERCSRRDRIDRGFQFCLDGK